MERIVADRSAPDTALVELDVLEPCHADIRPAGARSCRQQHDMVLTLLK